MLNTERRPVEELHFPFLKKRNIQSGDDVLAGTFEAKFSGKRKDTMIWGG